MDQEDDTDCNTFTDGLMFDSSEKSRRADGRITADERHCNAGTRGVVQMAILTGTR